MNTYSLRYDGTIDHFSPPVDLQEAKQLIIRRAGELVNELVKRRQREEPPFLAEALAPLLDIKEILKTDLGELSALLVRSRDGYILKVNASHHPVRQNFSCAHEIGHILLDELAKQHLSSGTDFRGISQVTGKTKERLCDIAATELLMPAPVFSKYLVDFGLCIDSVERLAHIFKVSIPAAAIRVQEIDIEGCWAIRWKRWQRNRSKGFIQDWTREPARRTYVRDPSALLKAYESNDTVKSFKCFEIGNVRKRCLLESKGFGHDKTRYVLSLVFPDR